MRSMCDEEEDKGDVELALHVSDVVGCVLVKTNEQESDRLVLLLY